jgi:hypothetical protein
VTEILQPKVWLGKEADPDAPPVPIDPHSAQGRQLLDEAEKRHKEEQREREDREEQAKFDDFERRKRQAADTVRREREQAEISGDLSGDAEAFYALSLKPRLTEAPHYRAKIKVPVVQGLFNKNSLCWTVGSSGTFKSFMTGDLAFRYGQEDMMYHGRKMTHGRALIVVAEGEDAYAHRKEAWEKQYQREVKNVTFFPGALQLGDVVKEMPALLHYLREEKEAGREYGLIVFDTQAMCTVGMDENSSEMNLVINVLHRIRQTTGACVMVVHHFGKDEKKGMRGSSMLYAAADSILALKRSDDAMEVTLSTAQADGGKQKDNPTEKDFLTLEMKSHVVGEDYFGDPVTSLAAVVAVKDAQQEQEEPQHLPTLTEVDMYYLRGIRTYQWDGATPSALRERLATEEYAQKLPRPPHRADRQTAGNRLQGLGNKDLVERVKGEKGKWKITPLGARTAARYEAEKVRREASEQDQQVN